MVSSGGHQPSFLLALSPAVGCLGAGRDIYLAYVGTVTHFPKVAVSISTPTQEQASPTRPGQLQASLSWCKGLRTLMCMVLLVHGVRHCATPEIFAHGGMRSMVRLLSKE